MAEKLKHSENRRAEAAAEINSLHSGYLKKVTELKGHNRFLKKHIAFLTVRLDKNWWQRLWGLFSR